ncbi:MAG: NosD domain-containing protein, partial [Deltaproteobacteria bacterium]
QIGVEAEVWMVDARTGKELWRIKEAVRYHEGGLPLSPIGAVMTIVSTAMNLRDIQRIRVINELGWKLNEKIPVPDGLKAGDAPVIKNAISNAKEGPFGKGKTVKLAMEGEKGLIGLFEISGFKKALPMKEVSPGEYLGEYTALPGDNVNEAAVIVYLRRPGGEESRWLDISGFLTIDTAPPPAVTGLKGRSFIDRVELAWTGVAAPDLKGYRIFKGIKPISDFDEAGFTEEVIFTDKLLEPKQGYYYRVAAMDAAGNVGERSEAARLALREREVVPLPERIKKDTVLNAGSYIVKGETVVENGVTLAAMPDVKIFFEKGASLMVLGALAANGEKDLMVEFLPKTPEERFRGVSIEGGKSSLRFVRVRGADAGISIKNSDTPISDSIIEYNGAGLISAGAPSPSITGSTVWHNTEGIKVDNSMPALRRNEITRNSTGVVVLNSSPDMTDNNIYSNGLNIDSSGPALTPGNNYLGSVNLDEMKLKGDMKISKTLDSPYPAGKPVEVFVNPYSTLSPEARKEKLAELNIKAGKYYRERNLGGAASAFEETLKIEEGATAYYYLALSYQGMEDNTKALEYLKKGVGKFPNDSNLAKAYGLLLHQLNQEGPAKAALREALRLNPGDRQIRFILERLEGK